jgi:predicted Zn-dependent protease
MFCRFLLAHFLIVIAGLLAASTAVCADELMLKDRFGNDFMAESASQDSRVANEVLYKAFASVRKGRLDEADRWIMYGMLKAPFADLMRARDDSHLLWSVVNAILKRENKTEVAAGSTDLKLLRALMQMRLYRPAEALKTLKKVEHDFPHHAAINQIRARINELDPPRVVSSLPSEAKNSTKRKVERELSWKQARFPLKVFIQAESESLAVSGYAPGDNAIIRSAFDAWQRQTSGSAKFRFVEDLNEADIVCSWESDPEKLGNKDLAGVCQTSRVDDYMTHAVIRILTVGKESSDDNFPALWRVRHLKEVCMHEIGHALGLDRHGNMGDVMYQMSHSRPLERLSLGDIEAYKKLVSIQK